MRKKGLFFVLLIIIGLLGYNYLYQDHRNISKEAPDIEITSDKISKEFSSEPQINEQKYLDKIIQISGRISEINDSDLTLDDGVFCQFQNLIKKKLKVGDSLTVKGRCIGYDDLLEQVKLNESKIIE